jgi:hypothetical protein
VQAPRDPVVELVVGVVTVTAATSSSPAPGGADLLDLEPCSRKLVGERLGDRGGSSTGRSCGGVALRVRCSSSPSAAAAGSETTLRSDEPSAAALASSSTGSQ